ncbi:three-helix bundle dimerization domain-containing protein [Rhodococcus sp. NPDC056743]|uniref:three-helix bundle dimerization domain-containing protein n=1 Tax=Rhodococcus sp. NPDC056743 TaxID=3345934 RepID=UPI00366F4F76
MTGDEELLQVEQVIARLITRYPTVSPLDIERSVRMNHQRLRSGRIRTFVPLLVEKAVLRDIAVAHSAGERDIPGHEVSRVFPKLDRASGIGA